MDHKILGDNLQVVNVQLENESVVADPGTFVYKSGNVEMKTEITGGVMAGLKRMFGGEELFLVEFRSDGKGLVGFGGDLPGKIKRIELGSSEEFFLQRGSFLCGTPGVKIEFQVVKRARAGVFGGQGIVLQKLSGPAEVFAHAAGDLLEYDLKSGEVLDVDTGHVVGFSPKVDFDIEYVGSIKSALFGGEGLFFARMKGPGKVIVQSMTRRMLKPRVVKSGGGGVNIGKIGKGISKMRRSNI